jgi:LacI family transcriptional regulator
VADDRRSPARSTITMRDVARQANVSQSTVSRVLSGAADPIAIGAATRQRVLEAVKQLGYIPNLHAGSLRGKKTRMLAMLIADIANPFYHPMVRAVQDVASQHRYDVMVANSDHMLDLEMQFLESVMRRPVDGVIAVPYHLDDSHFDELIARTGAKVAVVGQHLSHPEIDIAFGNDGKATRDTVFWLHRARGHTRIGYIGAPDQFPAGARRRRAFQTALREAGLDASGGYEQAGDWSMASGSAAMQRLLNLPVPPTAVVASNDLMAIGALDTVQQCGLDVPRDVAIVGFDDIPAALWVRPQLTTVAQYPGEMGRLLAEALFERLAGNYNGPGRRYEVPCRFLERDSA